MNYQTNYQTNCQINFDEKKEEMMQLDIIGAENRTEKQNIRFRDLLHWWLDETIKNPSIIPVVDDDHFVMHLTADEEEILFNDDE